MSRHRSRSYAALPALILLGLLGAPAESALAEGLPTEYVVSTEAGVHPEGIAIHHDGTMYVSSVGTGRLYRGDVSEGAMAPFDAEEVAARGVSTGVHTSHDGRIWSVGGAELTVHDRDGGLVASRTAEGGPLSPSYLNDLVLTPTAVYATDWFNPVIYRAEIRGTQVGELEPWLDIRSAAPGFPAQYWYLNGIVADPSGETLLVAANGPEATWRVDTRTRSVEQVDLGGQSFGPDGMVVNGDTLYAVLNYGAPTGIYIVDLAPDWRSGTIRQVVREDANGKPFDVPTTLAVFRCRMYVVNSQLNEADAQPPFTVSAIPDPTCT